MPSLVRLVKGVWIAAVSSSNRKNDEKADLFDLQHKSLCKLMISIQENKKPARQEKHLGSFQRHQFTVYTNEEYQLYLNNAVLSWGLTISTKETKMSTTSGCSPNYSWFDLCSVQFVVRSVKKMQQQVPWFCQQGQRCDDEDTGQTHDYRCKKKAVITERGHAVK